MITVAEIAKLYDLDQNAVVTMRGSVQVLPDGTQYFNGKIYRCGTGEKAEELLAKIAADGGSALCFNSDRNTISQCNV